MAPLVTTLASRAIALFLALELAPLGYATAQQRAAIVQSVDLLVPIPPAIVTVGGVPHLVHELHITNLPSAEVAITRLQVIGDAPNATLGDFRDSALASILARPGLRRVTGE